MQTALNLRKENAKLTSFCEPLPRFFCAGLRLELGFTEKIISSCWRAAIRTCPSRDYGYPGQQTYRRFLPAFVPSSRWNQIGIGIYGKDYFELLESSNSNLPISRLWLSRAANVSEVSSSICFVIAMESLSCSKSREETRSGVGKVTT